MSNAKKLPRSYSGMQPSSDSLHLGNLISALNNWVAMQADHECVYCIVDLHALTTPHDPKGLRERTRRTAAQYIAGGIDPEKSILYVQSHVPEHAQLTWILSCITGFGEAGRMTQFKDKSAKSGAEGTNVGLFTYPILMASDILLYDADVVPVGEDQRQHLELTRDLAIRFNSRYGDTLVVPEPYIVKASGKIQDLQNPTAKMSKSSDESNGVIAVLDDPKVISKRIKSAVTDADPDMVVTFDPEKKPGISNLLTIYSAFSGRDVEDICKEYTGRGYGFLKNDLADVVVEALRPIKERTDELLSDPEELDRLLTTGAQRAEAIASETLSRVYEHVGLLPRVDR